MKVSFSCPVGRHAACKCIATPCSSVAFAVLSYCTVQPEVLEVDGGLALHVHLAGKSVNTPLLRHSWSSHSATEMQSLML